MINLEKNNFESWKNDILTHLRWLDFLPYLYGLILTLDTLGILSTWGIISDHVVEVMCYSIDLDTMCVIPNINYPHTL